MKPPSDARFFDADTLEEGWARADAAILSAPPATRSGDSSTRLKAWVAHFGAADLLRLVVAERDGGAFPTVRVSALAGARERLAYADPLADLAFAMQGLGSYAITSHGDADLRAAWLPRVRAGEAIAAIALTEPDAGSDLGALRTTATERDGAYELTGHKVFISNAPVATFFVVLARAEPARAARPFDAFLVPADSRGLRVTPTVVLGDHPIGEVHLDRVRVSASHRLGAAGDGMAAALGTLHRFRPTVGAAALGFAARALDESVAHVSARTQFGEPLAALQAVQMRVAEMIADVTSARLLVYRAAACLDAAGIDRDTQSEASSLGKFFATEAAQRVIDHAVQLHGGVGVVRSHVVAQLYDEVRALRIYEGTTDVQKVLIARSRLPHNRGG